MPVTVILADQETTKLPVTTNRFGQRNGVETGRDHATETSYGDAPIARLKDTGEARSTP